MAYNSDQYGYWQDSSSRRVNEVNMSDLENHVSNLTTLVRQMVILQKMREQEARTCGICAAPSHSTNWCPTLQYDPYDYGYSVGEFLGSEQWSYGSYSYSSNQEWNDHPDFGVRPQSFQHFQPEQPFLPEQPSLNQGMSLEEIVKSLATNTLEFQQETRRSIQDLEHQLSQLASSVSRLVIVDDFEEDESAISLRSGKELKGIDENINDHPLEEEIQKEAADPQHEAKEVSRLNNDQFEMLVTNISFLAGFAKSKGEKEENGIVEVFHIIDEPKVEWQPVHNYSKCAFWGEHEIQSLILTTGFPEVKENIQLMEIPEVCKKSMSWILKERKGIG